METTLFSLTTPATLKCCQEYMGTHVPRTTFIASYPKSGTTWMQAIVFQLISNGNQSFSHISNFSPFFEVEKHWEIERSQVLDRFIQFHQDFQHASFNTHLTWELMPNEENFRYIYVIRSPKDVVVSYFHHLSNQIDDDCFTGDFKTFLTAWIAGKLPYGPWLNHLQSWVEASKRDPRILIVRYEDLKRDLPASLARISSHLELTYSESELRELSTLLTFEHMKQNETQYQPISIPWREGFSFLRKGEVSRGGGLFGPEEQQILDEMFSSKFPEGFPDWFRELELNM